MSLRVTKPKVIKKRAKIGYSTQCLGEMNFCVNIIIFQDCNY